MAPTPTIFWFRRDLRLADNLALLAAVVAGEGAVVATFIVDEEFIAPAGHARAAFLQSTLDSLDRSIGGALCVRVGEPAMELALLARELGARSVYATGDFGPKGRLRDQRVSEQLAREGVDVYFIDSPYVAKPGTVLTKAGAPCRVFGAFRRGWEIEARPGPLEAPSAVTWRSAPSASLDVLRERCAQRRPFYFGDLPDAAPTAMPLAGEVEAQRQLQSFAAIVDEYDTSRDRPDRDGTSRLSAHLRFGTLHPRQVLDALDGLSKGRATFRSEICWREFYADVLYHRPESVWQVLQPSLEHLRVDTDARAVDRFQAWARGETGYPLVDAGMRQLLAEGWMHNRVRMVCASFLVKHLHLDWRWGAKWFMWRLVDGDLASNQHGWQWTAGTGTDAAPFHRVFNPTLQAQRFDHEGHYVQRYVSALRVVGAPQCLQPGGGEGLLAVVGYPSPIVDAADERREALARFAEARELARTDP